MIKVPPELMKLLEQKIIEAARDSTYGAISFNFQNGVLTSWKIEKTEKPPVDAKLKG